MATQMKKADDLRIFLLKERKVKIPEVNACTLTDLISENIFYGKMKGPYH